MRAVLLYLRRRLFLVAAAAARSTGGSVGELERGSRRRRRRRAPVTRTWRSSASYAARSAIFGRRRVPRRGSVALMSVRRA